MLKRKYPTSTNNRPKRQALEECWDTLDLLKPILSISVFRAMAVASKASLEAFWPLFLDYCDETWPIDLWDDTGLAWALKIASSKSCPDIYRRFVILRSAHLRPVPTYVRVSSMAMGVSICMHENNIQQAYAETKLLRFSRTGHFWGESPFAYVEGRWKKLFSICRWMNFGAFEMADKSFWVHSKTHTICFRKEESSLFDDAWYHCGYYRLENISVLQRNLNTEIPIFWRDDNDGHWTDPAFGENAVHLQQSFTDARIYGGWRRRAPSRY